MSERAITRMMENSEVTVVEDVALDAELWKHMPSELHENILQHCSVLDICRLRTVCRAWNDLTHQRDFAIRARPRDTFIFKAPDSIFIYLTIPPQLR